jgi:hypothetical protein
MIRVGLFFAQTGPEMQLSVRSGCERNVYREKERGRSVCTMIVVPLSVFN